MGTSPYIAINPYLKEADSSSDAGRVCVSDGRQTEEVILVMTEHFSRLISVWMWINTFIQIPSKCNQNLKRLENLLALKS